MGTRYAQLSIEERRRIESLRAANVSPTKMARVLGRHRSTIFREFRCNHFVDRCMPKVLAYLAMAAQLQSSSGLIGSTTTSCLNPLGTFRQPRLKLTSAMCWKG